MSNHGGSGARQIFYTHVMKTGGTSLNRVLRAHFDAASSYPSEESDEASVATKTFTHLLLDLDDRTRGALRFFSVHQPAWVAWAAAPDSLKITVLREPVARTISHLRQLVSSPHTPDDIEAIYHDDGWRSRLANYQTQIFADQQARHDEAGSGALDADALEGERRATFEDALVKLWGTAIAEPLEVGPEQCAQAIANLDRYDCVGITEDLPGMAARLAELTGFDLAAMPNANVGSSAHTIPPALLELITADNKYDLQLYARASMLARSDPGRS